LHGAANNQKYIYETKRARQGAKVTSDRGARSLNTVLGKVCVRPRRMKWFKAMIELLRELSYVTVT